MLPLRRIGSGAIVSTLGRFQHQRTPHGLVRRTARSGRILNSSGLLQNCWSHSFANHSGYQQISDKRREMPGENKKRVITVSVDGNISSGKSTLVSKLKELFPRDFSMQVDLVPEPLEKWTNMRGHNLLGMFYEDSVKHNFIFQHYVQLTRLIETIKKPSEAKSNLGNENGTVRIMERSLQNNRYCFIELARREGRLHPAEFAVLDEWHQWMENNFDLTLDLIIYLRTTPETVYNRMLSRGREEESSVPIDYLSNLHDTYEDWLIKGDIDPTKDMESKDQNLDTSVTNQVITKKLGRTTQKVIVIDATQSKEDVAKQCATCLKSFMVDIGIDVDSHAQCPTKKRKHYESNE